MKFILEKALSHQFLTFDEALTIYKTAPLSSLMAIAQQIRFDLHPDNQVTWQIDRNINTTNVCVSGCRFCNFHCRLSERDRSYITTIEEYRRKITEMFEHGGDQILLQGGMHPELGVEYYEELFGSLKAEFPTLKLNALGAPEVFHLARKAGVTPRRILERLRAAGLDSLPGAGAEILNNEVRRMVSPGKCSADEWIEVMRQAHDIGLPTTATMMYGHVEKAEHRIEHLMRIRDLQEQTGGFTAFIPWAYQGCGTELSRMGYSGSNNVVEYLRLVAISRVVLLNVSNVQASWLTMGVSAAQVALHSGANDMGSIMIEENVVSQAGASHSLDSRSMQEAIYNAGFIPRLRDQQYNFRDHNLCFYSDKFRSNRSLYQRE